MVKSADDIVSLMMVLYPEEMMHEIIGERIENMDVKHTQSRTSPRKRQTVGRFEVGPSSEEEYDPNIFGDAGPRKKRSPCHRSSSSRTMTTTRTRAIEQQRSVTSVEPVLQNPNLGLESSPSSYVSRRSKEKRPINVEKRSRKKRKVVSPLEVEPIQTTPSEWLLNVMRREENGYNPKLISTRQLFQTDLRTHQARLSVPFKQVINPDFLTENETRIINENAMKIRDDGVSVDLVDPNRKKHELELRKWKMSGNWYYNFVKGWKNVLDANNFKEEDVYPLWSFRSGTESGRGNSLPGGDGASTSGESGQVPVPPPPARESSYSGQGCSGASSSSSS
ncbi:hypothetical protein ARALYDRAFT_902266 [Arabidopsis lyrata subsp. lyrata]|uniref:TF-B3 domain-containing protein n=1 Tax=Arabidopsis lyrata subsp. lyrata TaxID=81972 RepID=D7LEV8_ARALL|nr:hypothetical protein ARALYDRAFT_902266 [Arabidopsis lyrata subsp. lyrata]